MTPFYLVVDQIGDKIHERYIDSNGKEAVRQSDYQPTLFFHAQEGFKTKHKDIYGKPVIPKQFASISEAKEWKMRQQGVLEVLGMDDFEITYIADTYRDDIQYDQRYIRVANCDIEVTGDEFPDPTYAKFPIDAITHYDSIDDKYYVFDLLNSQYGSVSKWNPELAGKPESEGGDEVPKHLLEKVVYMSFETEQELLMEYINFWEEKTPVIFTGWNVEGFDIPYIMNRVKNVLGPSQIKRFSPFGRVRSKIIQNVYGDKEIFIIAGVEILDYMDLYKKFSFTVQPTYKLDYVTEYEVGLNKLAYDGPINKLRENNHQRYISYNIVDVYCVQAIDKKRGFINLAISMGYYAKTNFSGVMSPIKTWDSIIFNSLLESNDVVPQGKHNIRQPFMGAYVKDPKPGSYKYVISFDVTSLYPSIIRQINISPETIAGTFSAAPLYDYIHKIAPKPSEEFSCSPNGMMYSKLKQGIIPRETAKVFFQRKDWKKKMKTAERNAEKIKAAIKAKSNK